MTSLQHHSHLLNHHSTSAGSSSVSNTGNSLNVSLNASNNLSPVIQHKIDVGSSFNRYSSGSGGASMNGPGINGPDFDTTSIASISESSHWSGGGGDDLDNVALVNGSDCINTMENKDWSTYIKMAKNGYNSSDEDNNTNNNDDDDSNDEQDESKEKNDGDQSLCDDHVNSKHKTQSIKSISSNSSGRVAKNSAPKMSSKSNIISRKTTDNNSKSDLKTAKHQAKLNPNTTNKTLNKENLSNSDIAETKLKQKANNLNTESIQTSNKKIRKKVTKQLPLISQDSFESSKPENESTDGVKFNRKSSLSDEELNNISNNTNTLHDVSEQKKIKIKSSETEHGLEEENFEDDSQDEVDSDEMDDDEDYEDDDEEDDDEDDEDDLDDDDIWTIKPKLYSYYEKQFKTMEPNLNGFIIGTVAKPFFERSKLPLNELSKIWELSDVTKDGALSFAEFCTAMHLVVLRVRNFELPNELPEKLQPYAPLIDFNTDAPLKQQITHTNEESILNVSDIEDIGVGSPGQPPRMVSGPTGGSLVQFSLKPQVPNDAQIAHPVALRYNQNQQQNPSLVVVPEPPPRHSRSSSLGTINNPLQPANLPTAPNTQTTTQPPSIQAPTITQNTPGSVSLPSAIVNTPKILQQQPVVPPRITSPPPVYHQPLPQEPQQQVHSGALLPPPPPPLTHHQLHQYQNQNRLHHHQQAYPQTPQGTVLATPQSGVRAPPPLPTSTDDIAKGIEKLVEQMNLLNNERLKKISDTIQKQSVAVSSSTSSTNSNMDVDTLALSVKAQTEQNQLLRRVFAELEKELRALTDNRIALEIKLDYLNTAAQSTNQQGANAAIPTTPVAPTNAPSLQASNPASSVSASNSTGQAPSITTTNTPVVHSKINL